MSTVLNAFPGQKVTIVFETLNSLGVRADGYEAPQITRIIFPNLSLATGYPAFMTELDIGLYSASFTLPGNAAGVGTYIVDILYVDPDTNLGKQTFFQVVVTAPMGQYTASTF